MTGWAFAVIAILAVSFCGCLLIAFYDDAHQPEAFELDDWAELWNAVYALPAREPRTPA